MHIRVAALDDAEAIAAIYRPIVIDSAISFEVESPSSGEMRERIGRTLERLPWYVSLDGHGDVDGYAYASRHRDRAAYQWSVDVSAYVREDSRGKGIGKSLYCALTDQLCALGYCQAFAGIALPNPASIALHESVGFRHIGTYKSVGYKLGLWHDVGWWQKELRGAGPAPPIRLFGMG